MKIIREFVITCFIASAVHVSAQFDSTSYADSIQFKDSLNYEEEGIKFGWWIAHWGNGQVKSKVFYLDGYEKGTYVEYLRDGTLVKEIHYRIGEYHGWYKSFWRNGNVFIDCYYEYGYHHGPWVGINYNGKRRRESNFSIGIFHGLYTEYFEYPGRVKITGEMFSGKRDGKWKAYYRNGKLKWEVEYEDGIPNGVWIWYDRKESVKRSFRYVDGVKIE